MRYKERFFFKKEELDKGILVIIMTEYSRNLLLIMLRIPSNWINLLKLPNYSRNQILKNKYAIIKISTKRC